MAQGCLLGCVLRFRWGVPAQSSTLCVSVGLPLGWGGWTPAEREFRLLTLPQNQLAALFLTMAPRRWCCGCVGCSTNVGKDLNVESVLTQTIVFDPGG